MSKPETLSPNHVARPRIAIPEPTSTIPDYNKRCWPQYAAAVEACGGQAVAVPLGRPPAETAALISTCAGVVLPGSPADVHPQKYGRETLLECGLPDPLREAADELLLQDAFNLRKPVFGVCYGLQSLNVWRNGSLIQHLRQERVQHDAGPEVTEAHLVELDSASKVAALLADASDVNQSGAHVTLATNSSHHQAVETPGDDLAIAARAIEDGVVEALEGRRSNHWVVGVQWHPERTMRESPASEALFRAFVEAARAWHTPAIEGASGR